MLLYCSIHYVLKRNIYNDLLNRENPRLTLKCTIISCIGLDVRDLRASCLLTSKRGTSGLSGPPVYYHVLGELRAPCECTMYRCREPQGSRSASMHRGISGPLVNVQCIYVGDLRAPGLMPCIDVGDISMHQGIFNKKLSCIPHINYLKAKCLKALQLLYVVARTDWGTDKYTFL